MLNWLNRFNICCFLDNHQYRFSHNSIECLAAAGCSTFISTHAGDALEQFQHFYDSSQDWIFGHFGYDLKNEIERLSSHHHDGIGFPDLFFFIPEVVLKLQAGELSIGTASGHSDIFQQVMSADVSQTKNGGIVVQNRYSKDQYISAVARLKQHILKGDCYEINFCQEFFAENAEIAPLALYQSLSDASPNPFSAFYKMDDKYLLCFSPERYLKKEGTQILSQPMKGTLKRTEHDKNSKQELHDYPKERAENIMIVDLVRNDLSRVCTTGSVQVDELCEVYTFPQVYQMISTVSGQLRPDITLKQILAATFPMGSMTGAPKKRVMELIEQYEGSRRGLFSGSVGYFSPSGDFDLNVVIRSVLYNAASRYLSFHTGSAITFASDPEAEYEECLLKANTIRQALA